MNQPPMKEKSKSKDGQARKTNSRQDKYQARIGKRQDMQEMQDMQPVLEPTSLMPHLIHFVHVTTQNVRINAE